MGKKKGSVEHGKGAIVDNVYAALVRSPLYRPKRFRKKTGKGSYTRKGVGPFILSMIFSNQLFNNR